MSFADEFEWAPADEAAVRYSSVKYATQKLVTNIGSRLQSVKAHCQRLQRLCRGHAQPSEVKYEKQQMLREEEDVKQMMTQLIRLKSRLDHRDYYLLEGQLEPLVDQYAGLAQNVQAASAAVAEFTSSLSRKDAEASTHANALSPRLQYEPESPKPPEVIEVDGEPSLFLLQDTAADAHVQEAVARQRERDMAELERNVVDLNGMFQSLLSHVREQGDAVDDIERNMDHAEQEVHKGVGHLLKARRYTTAAWPVAGALVGAMIFGPVGLAIGAKVGAGLMAAGGAAAGGLGGAALKRREAKQIDREENAHRDRGSSKPLVPRKR